MKNLNSCGVVWEQELWFASVEHGKFLLCLDDANWECRLSFVMDESLLVTAGGLMPRFYPRNCHKPDLRQHHVLIPGQCLALQR